MAKVKGPLMSMEASGKLGDTIVFFPWKGRNVVRLWVKPTQKNSVLQGYVRASMSAVGRWMSKISCISKGSALDSALYTLIVAKTTEGLNWNAYAVQGFLKLVTSGGAISTDLFASKIANYSALVSTALTAFKTDATALGLVDVSFGYGYTDAIEAGCQLYFGALGCYNNSVGTASPYNTHPDSWVDTDVNSFKADMITA